MLAAGLGHHVRNALVAVRTFIDLAPEMLDREDLDMEALRYPNFWTDFYKKVQAKMRQIVRLLMLAVGLVGLWWTRRPLGTLPSRYREPVVYPASSSHR